MPHLVCIISDQAVPNLLFIKQFAQPDSEFFFVTTEEMEHQQSTDNLIRSIRLDEKLCRKIIIDANDAMITFNQLRDFPFPKKDQYLINLTGGNKLMSQMVFQHFLDYDSKMYYAPIASVNYQQLYPEVLSLPKDDSIKLTLDQYLYAYGFEIISDVPYFEGKPKPSVLFQKVLQANGAGRVPEIAKATSEDYKEADKNYLNGGWFEFYCFQFFKQAFQLSDSQIACSVGLKKVGSNTAYEHDNEFDLMFIHQNDLFVFECKVYKSQAYKKDKFHDPMYKLASLTREFGLKCKKYLAILADLPDSTDTQEQMDQLRKNLGIDKLITLTDFKKYRDSSILKNTPFVKIDYNQKLKMLKDKYK